MPVSPSKLTLASAQGSPWVVTGGVECVVAGAEVEGTGVGEADAEGVADGATVVTDGRAVRPLEAVLSPDELEHPASVRLTRTTRAPLNRCVR